MSSHIEATYRRTDRSFHVSGYERIDFNLLGVDGAFAVENTEIADSYRSFGRCLMIIDANVHEAYDARIEAYFEYHGIALTAFPLTIRETQKSLATLERIVDDRRLRAAAHGAGAGGRGVG